MLDQRVKHASHPAAIFHPRVQLSVAVGTRAALAKAVVAVTIHAAMAVEGFEVVAPRLLAAANSRTPPLIVVRPV